MRNGWIFAVLGVIALMWVILFEFLPTASGDLDLLTKVKSHPDVVDMGGWYRIIIKENLSNTPFDWRFDLRKISINENDCSIGHRMEQMSGAHPTSSWVIEYAFIDYGCDGVMEEFFVDRFISIQDGDGWFRTTPHWPDKFKYPQDNISHEEADKIFKKELQYWNNVLKGE